MAMPPPAEMQSARVVLRKLELADAGALYAAASDREVVHFMDWSRALDLAETTEHLQQADARWVSGEEYQ